MFSIPHVVRGGEPAPYEVLESGIRSLDAILPQGGIPRGRLTEITGRRSSGKRTLAAALCSRAIARGEQVAWIDAHAQGEAGSGKEGGFYPLPALEWGAPLDRLLLVRVPADDPQRAFKAADLLLAARGAVGLLVIDLPPSALRQPVARLARLQRGAEQSGTALLFITERLVPSASLGTFVALQLAVWRGKGKVESQADRAVIPLASRRRPRRRDGVRRDDAFARVASLAHLEVQIIKSKLGQMARSGEVAIHEPHSLRLDTTL